MLYPEVHRLLARQLDQLADLYDLAPELLQREHVLREYQAARLALRALDSALEDWHWNTQAPVQSRPDPLTYAHDGVLKRRPRRQTMQSVRAGLTTLRSTLHALRRDHPTIDAYRDTRTAAQALLRALDQLTECLTARHGPRPVINPDDLEV